MVELCRSRGVDAATVAIAFTMRHPVAASTLVGMPRIKEVEQNLAALNYEVPTDLTQEVEAIVGPVKHLIWPSGRPENDD